MLSVYFSCTSQKCTSQKRPFDNYVNNTGPEALPVSVFLTLVLDKSWDKIQPTEHLKLNQKVKQTPLRCFLYM